jgi:hypothetical protein
MEWGKKSMLESNPQLNLYGLAALRWFSVMTEFKTVRTVIHQPRLNHVSERVQTVDQMEDFALEVVGAAAATTLPNAPLVPTTKGCRWCKAKSTCPAIAEAATEMFEAVRPDDVATDDLSVAMSKVELIEGWCKSIRAETEKRLLDGRAVAGWKLVQGKRGNRAWADAEAAEAWLKARLKLDELYDFKLASPTTITKRLADWVDADGEARKPVLGPRQRKELETMITQSEGKPSVAPESDKRPAIVADEFSPVSQPDFI